MAVCSPSGVALRSSVPVREIERMQFGIEGVDLDFQILADFLQRGQRFVDGRSAASPSGSCRPPRRRSSCSANDRPAAPAWRIAAWSGGVPAPAATWRTSPARSRPAATPTSVQRRARRKSMTRQAQQREQQHQRQRHGAGQPITADRIEIPLAHDGATETGFTSGLAAAAREAIRAAGDCLTCVS